MARELGRALTAFLLPPQDPTNTARARLFSAQGECRFRLEAVLALAAFIAKSRAADMLRRGGLTISLELGGVTWRCDVIANSAGVLYSETRLGPKPRRADPPPLAEPLAAVLGLALGEIGFGAHLPSRFEALGGVDLPPLRTRAALLKAADGAALLPSKGLLLYTNDAAAPEASIEARAIGLDLGAETLAALAGAAVEFERPPDGAHEIFIDMLHGHGRRARLTLRLDILDGALGCLSLGAQTAFVATGEFRP
jgi:trans-2,3-dihydro-3-hydroxyanthranilate isomerase